MMQMAGLSSGGKNGSASLWKCAAAVAACAALSGCFKGEPANSDAT